MGGRSSISRNPKVQAAVERLIAEGYTIDEVSDAVSDYGISRSAVGRYAQRYRPLVDGLIRDKAIKDALKKHMPDVDSTLIDIALQRAQAEVLRSLDEIGDRDTAASSKEIAALVRALRTLINAMRDKKSYEAEVRDDERRRAADAAESAARSGGVTQAQIDKIKRSILGIAA